MELQVCSLDCVSDTLLLSWLCLLCCTSSLSVQGAFPHFMPLLAGTTFEVMDHFASAVSRCSLSLSLTSALMDRVVQGSQSLAESCCLASFHSWVSVVFVWLSLLLSSETATLEDSTQGQTCLSLGCSYKDQLFHQFTFIRSNLQDHFLEKITLTGSRL